MQRRTKWQIKLKSDGHTVTDGLAQTKIIYGSMGGLKNIFILGENENIFLN